MSCGSSGGPLTYVPPGPGPRPLVKRLSRNGRGTLLAPTRGAPQNGVCWNSTWASAYTTFWPSFWWLLLFARCICFLPALYGTVFTLFVFDGGPFLMPGLMSAAIG